MDRRVFSENSQKRSRGIIQLREEVKFIRTLSNVRLVEIKDIINKDNQPSPSTPGVSVVNRPRPGRKVDEISGRRHREQRSPYTARQDHEQEGRETKFLISVLPSGLGPRLQAGRCHVIPHGPHTSLVKVAWQPRMQLGSYETDGG
jgi:hypothetical protein